MQRQPQRRSKRFAKVRTGCLTCKQRRVKCDEAKPVCQRCKTGRFQCAGYDPPKAWIFDPQPRSSRHFQLLGNELVNTSDSTVPLCLSSTVNTRIPFRSNLCTTSQCSRPSSHEVSLPRKVLRQHEHDQRHRNTTIPVPVLPSYGTAEDCRAFQFFLETCAAQIGKYYASSYWSVLVPQAGWHHPAVKQSILAVAHTLEPLISPESGGLVLRQRHLQHYNAAISALLHENPGPEVVLITCSMLWACECINGSALAAKTHIDGALKILEEWRSAKLRRGGRWMDADYLIADGITPTYDAMREWAERGVADLEDVVVSSCFELSLEDLQIRLSALSSFSHSQEAAGLLTACIQYLLLLRAASTTTKSATTQLRFLLSQWYGTLLLTPLGKMSAFTRTILGLHHLATIYLTNHEEEDPESIAEDCHVEFPEPLLLRSVFVCKIKHAAMNSRFAELGLIPPLFMLGRYAPSKVTRRAALENLRSLHRVEGLWDSCIAAGILGQIMAVEDEADRERLSESELGGKWTPSVGAVSLDLCGEHQDESWMEWTWASRSCRKRSKRMQLKVTDAIISKLRLLPKGKLDSLIRNFGYQDVPSERNGQGSCSCTMKM